MPLQPGMVTMHRSTRGRYAVLRGRKSRVQLLVSDLTGPQVPKAVRDVLPTFIVYEIPSVAHPAYPFTSGKRRYYGRDPWDAIAAAERAFGLEIFPDEDFPADFARYFAEPDM